MNRLFLTLVFTVITGGAAAAPGDILYQNQFSTNGQVTSDWSRLSGNGNDFQASTETYNSASRSLRIRDGSGGRSNSGLINASVAGAEVSFWLRQGSPSNAPESGEDLELSYYNSNGSWVLLATYDGSDASGTVYTPTITLPADALHNNLRFEFDMSGGGNNDRWYVDDFTVAESGGSSCSVADNFNTVAYNQNNGSNDWLTDWVEIGESDGPSAGIARVRNDNCTSGNCLRLGVPSGSGSQTYSNRGVYREAYLEGATSATLTFNYRTGYASGTPNISLWASDDGGATWTVLQTYSFFSTSFSATPQSFDLTPYISSNTQIRFLAEGAGAITGFYVDDLQISYDTENCPEPPSYSLELHYNFDEGTGQTIADDSGNNRTGTLGAAVGIDAQDPSFFCEASGFVMEFDRNNNEHIITPSFSPPANGAVAFWLKVPALPTSRQRIFGFGDGYEIRWESDDVMYFDVNKTGSNSSIRTSSAITTNQVVDNWLHVAIVTSATNNTWSVYLNGALDNSGSETLTPQSDAVLTIGGSTWRSTSEHLSGFIDDFRVYSGELTASDIAALATTPPADCAQLIANFQMDESSWNGTNAEVADQTGSYNAVAVNGAFTGSSAPAITGDPGTCGYGNFDGSNDYIELPNAFENLQDSFSVTAWINPSNVDSGSRIFIDDENNSHRGFGFSLGDPGNGRLRFYSRGVSPISVDTVQSIAPNTWTFVTAVHDAVNKSRQIYINGVVQTITGGGTSNTYTGTWGTASGPATIGGETDLGETNNRFTGAMDEVRIYRGALTASQVAAIYAETHACDNVVPIHHYQIEHDGNGLTCAAEPITIKACTNASCATLSSDSVSLDLQADGSTKVSPTFTGSTTVNMNHTVAETLTLSVANPTITPSNSVECDSGGGSSCDIEFANTGFRFLVNNVATDIPVQLSGKPSNTGFNSATLSLQAVRTSPESGACEAAITNNVNVEMAAKCENPSTCASDNVVINSTTIPTLDNASGLSYSNVAMNFGDSSDNTADFIFTYPDAGQMKLYVRYNIPVDNVPSGSYMSGNSNSFVVRPFGFHVGITDLPVSLDGDAEDPVFKKADEPFEMALTAVQWQSGDDNNNDGIPDSNALISGNATTNNFGNETAPESAEISATIFAPAAGSSGDLTNDIFTGSGFSNGQMTRSDIRWSEVGIVTLSANLSDNSYLGETDITGSELVGRFKPDEFLLVSSTNGSLRVMPGNLPFAYVGQMDGVDGAIKYLVEPEFTLRAVNVNDGATLNYTFNDDSNAANDFMKLSASDVKLASITTDTATNGVDATLIDLNANISGNLAGDGGVAGEMTFTMDSDNHFVYQHILNARVAPFASDIDIIISAINDGDETSVNGVELADTNGANDGVLKLDPAGVPVRFGRWYIENNFGPETEDLPMFMFAQHWDGSNFVTNTLDSHTAHDFSNDANYTLNNTGLSPALSPAVTGISGVPSTFANGLGSFILDKPSDGSQGQIRLIYDTPPVWLKYDWDDDDSAQDGPYDDNPSAIGSFGLYRGNDRIIYWREVSN